MRATGASSFVGRTASIGTCTTFGEIGGLDRHLAVHSRHQQPFLVADAHQHREERHALRDDRLRLDLLDHALEGAIREGVDLHASPVRRPARSPISTSSIVTRMRTRLRSAIVMSVVPPLADVADVMIVPLSDRPRDDGAADRRFHRGVFELLTRQVEVRARLSTMSDSAPAIVDRRCRAPTP